MSNSEAEKGAESVKPLKPALNPAVNPAQRASLLKTNSETGIVSRGGLGLPQGPGPVFNINPQGG